ncbi:photosynthetic NDH subunit of subcomplex B 3, chloroplastic-like [Olea europaea var. sylvestris]|uniref:photosynthetic NDH subunit of subcomplex B 3, chloroplastic-like n=1 Tax=Olea europaea var. sylvestris TaxID=158386 RepID=UPI000C1D2B3D|nr:photosynthetic NDH subunit of subcomplex B 3, chloroplastic-like [Olea europaea var. sylvestris]
MGILQLNSHNLASFSVSHNFSNTPHRTLKGFNILSLPRGRIPAIGTTRQSEPETAVSEEETTEAAVNFAFVSSVLLPDGTPDVHYRTACGGQKLRDIMLDNNVELYGPYARPLLNCGGGGTCGTCLVEVVEGRELLTPRTDKEKEKLKRNPKNWRLACQTTVGNADSRGLVVIQQLPEWKGHDWVYGKEPPPEDETATI